LAWLVHQPAVITIPMSFDPQHQADNLAAADIELTESELAQLAEARRIDVF
jgi:diketogulonate reductase-like aldo/keto reductase